MGTCNELVADSNYFVALFNAEDALHSRAVALAAELEQAGCIIVVTSLVFSEAVTVISQRRGKDAATKAGEYVRTRSDVRWLYVSEERYKESWEMFKQVPHKNISLTDCSIVATARAEGIRDILTFDTTDFKKLQKQHRFRIVN